MPLRLALAVFTLAWLFSIPALAKDQEVEGRVESISVTTAGGLSFRIEGKPALCSYGKTPVSKGGLAASVTPAMAGSVLQTPDWVMDLLLEAKRTRRPVRVVTEPAGTSKAPYCRVVAITLL